MTRTQLAGATGARRRARRAAMQAIYQWLLNETEGGDLVLQFERAGYLDQTDAEYFRSLVRGVVGDPDALEAVFVGALDRNLQHLDAVEHAVLLLATQELAHCPEVPYRVVINEALELAKRYGAQDSHRYINGVLDKAARQLRGAEIGRK